MLFRVAALFLAERWADRVARAQTCYLTTFTDYETLYITVTVGTYTSTDPLFITQPVQLIKPWLHRPGDADQV